MWLVDLAEERSMIGCYRCPITVNCPITTAHNDKWRIKQLIHQSHLGNLYWLWFKCVLHVTVVLKVLSSNDHAFPMGLYINKSAKPLVSGHFAAWSDRSKSVRPRQKWLHSPWHNLVLSAYMLSSIGMKTTCDVRTYVDSSLFFWHNTGNART